MSLGPGQVLEMEKSKSWNSVAKVDGVNTELHVLRPWPRVWPFLPWVLKPGNGLVLRQSASGCSTISRETKQCSGSVSPLLNYQTSILADYWGEGLGKVSPAQATVLGFSHDDSGLQVPVFPESLPVYIQVGLSLSRTQINPLGTTIIEWLVALALVSGLSRKDSVCSPGRH